MAERKMKPNEWRNLKAKEMVENFVNSCQCQSTEDVKINIVLLLMMCEQALHTVMHGKKDIVQ